VPEVYDQTSAFISGEIALYDDYQGAVDQTDNARQAVVALGDASVALLQNHGVLVVGNNIGQAYLRAATIEWRSRVAWHVESIGGGQPLGADVRARFAAPFDHVNFPGLFEAMARRELRADPTVVE
jgi:ribulose-5-phosphate 4-epimerase/fuculose-1-phosphate aldolase